MHFTRKLFATSAIAAACAVPAAVLLSATASADPVPAPAPALPAMPNIPFLSGLTPANAPAMLQGLASAFSGVAGMPAAAPAAAPVAPVPAATASVTLPQPAALPATPAAAAVPAAAGLVPTAEVKIPQSPLNPVPLPPQLEFPGDLTSLMPAGTPLANLLPKSPAAVTPVAATVPAAAAPALPAATEGLGTLMFPVAGLP